MKRRKRIFVLLLVLMSIAYYLLFGSPLVDWRNAKLAEATQTIGSEPITLEELVPFEWDAVYIFAPYTPKETIAETLGFFSVEINESWTESANWYYFVKGNRIVSNPENSSLGCYISLPNHREGRSIGSVHYGDHIRFAIKDNPNGRLILEPVVDEVIVYNGREYRKSELSYATLQWLALPEEKRMVSSYIPPEFLTLYETWGITLEAENITPTGIVLKCTQSGGDPAEQLQTGSWYIVERWTQEYGWREVDHVLKGELVWTMEAWSIPANDTL